MLNRIVLGLTTRVIIQCVFLIVLTLDMVLQGPVDNALKTKRHKHGSVQSNSKRFIQKNGPGVQMQQM